MDNKNISVDLEINVKDGSGGNAKNNSTKKRKKDYSQIREATKGIAKDSKNIKRNLKEAFNKSGVIAWALVIKNTVNDMLKFSEAQTEYIENLNLMQVAFGETRDEAESFINTLQSAIGFDASNLTRQTGVFRQIASAMHYTSDVADTLSKNLTKMALDVSSLYNVTFDRAAKSLESAITGNIRSIRSLTGADITQATLQQEALAMGITKSVKEMSKAEKTILIYLSLERQLANANGDLSRTINSVANQTKIFKDQIAVAGRQIGAIFIPVLKTLLPLLNGILMAFNEIMATVLGLFGIDASSLAAEFGIASSNLELIESDLDGVAEASDKANKSLRGFDKLNVIRTPETSSANVGVGGVSGIDKKLLEKLKEYNLQLEEMNNKATEIRDNILDWLGFSKEENGELKLSKVTWGGILTAVLGVAAAYGGVKKVAGALKGLGSLIGLGGAGAAATGTAAASGAAAAGEAAAVTTLTTGAAIAAALTGIGKAALAALGTYFALEGGTYGVVKLLEKIADVDLDNLGSKLVGTSEETVKALQPVQDSFDDVASTINKISYSNLKVGTKEKKQITDSITNLTKTLKTKLKDYVDEAKKQAKDLFDKGFITKKQYNAKLKELDDYQKEQSKIIDNQKTDLIKKSKELFDEEGNLNKEKYAEFLQMLNNYNNDSLKALTLSVEDKKKIEENAQKYSQNQLRTYYSELLTEYAKDRDAAIQAAKDKKDKTIEEIKNLYDESDPEYAKLIAQAEKTYQEEYNAAKKSYDDIYDYLATTTTNMSDFIDKDDGHIISSWERVSKEFKKAWSTTVDDVKNLFISLGNYITGKGWTVETTASYTGSSGGGFSGGGGRHDNSTVKVTAKANGGFVEDGLFFANHNEMVGKFSNGKTAVANNDQIVKGISQGVANAIISTGGMNNRPVVIKAEGDANGLMSFIRFKQQEDDLQYGN